MIQGNCFKHVKIENGLECTLKNSKMSPVTLNTERSE